MARPTSPSARPTPTAAPEPRRRAPRLLPPAALVAKTRRDLRRQLAQFVAVAVTVLLGVALFVASFDAYRNLEASYATTYARLRFADLVVSGGDVASFSREAAGVAGVDAVATRTRLDVPLRLGPGSPYGRVVGLPAGGQPEVDRVDVVAGRYLDPARPDGVLVERHAAEHFGLGPGSTVQAFAGGTWHDWAVIGVADSPEYLWPARSRQDIITDPDSFAVVFAPEPAARALAGAAGPNQALVRLHDGAAGDAAGRLDGLARAAGAADVQPRADQPSNAALHEDINGFAELSVAFPLLFLTAAAVAGYVLLTRRVLSERPVIGMLRAGGTRTGPIVVHELGHGVLAGLAGAVPGAALGAVATAAVTRAYTAAIDVPDTVIGGHPATLAAGVAFGVLVGLVGGAAPAFAAARVAPAEAMRGIAVGAEPPGRWSRAVARARWLPTTARLALRDVARSRRRTAATMIGVVLALVLVLSSGGLIDSTRTLVDLQFGGVDRESADLVVDPARQEVLVGDVGGLAGVESAEPGLAGPVTVTAGDRSYATTLRGFVAGTTMHGFHSGDGSYVDLPAHGVLAGQALADRLGIAAGDTVTLRAGDGTTTTATVSALVDEPLGSFVYGTTATAAAALGDGPGRASLVLARYAPGADRGELRTRASDLPGVVAYRDADALAAQVDRYLGLFWVFIGVMAGLGGVLAFVTIFVTMTVNVAERTTELATMRAAGVPAGRIAWLVANESLVATLLGVPIGLALGYLTADAFMRSFSSDLFSFGLSLSWTTVVASVAAVVVAAMVSQVPALRSIRRLDVARVVRERAA